MVVSALEYVDRWVEEKMWIILPAQLDQCAVKGRLIVVMHCIPCHLLVTMELKCWAAFSTNE